MQFLECLHQVLAQMLHTAELDMAKKVTPNDVDVFLDNVAWAICSTYHTVLKASPGMAIFGRNLCWKEGPMWQSFADKHTYY
jgi:hypothetical protein